MPTSRRTGGSQKCIFDYSGHQDKLKAKGEVMIRNYIHSEISPFTHFWYFVKENREEIRILPKRGGERIRIIGQNIYP